MVDDTSPASRGAKGGAARAAKLSPQERSAIAKQAAAKRWNAITKKSNESNELIVAKAPNPITSGQGDLFIEKQIEIDGVGMGVLSDGTAFLTGRGLARLCGIANPRIVEMGQDWDRMPAPPMVAGI